MDAARLRAGAGALARGEVADQGAGQPRFADADTAFAELGAGSARAVKARCAGVEDAVERFPVLDQGDETHQWGRPRR